MKVYLAGRFDERERVRSMQAHLRERGHEIIVDWTTHDPVGRHGERPDLSRAYAEEDLRGVVEADVFILLTSATVGTGTHTELGVAIREFQATGKPLVYVIGDHTSRSVMYFHPAVERRADLETVLRELGGVTAYAMMPPPSTRSPS
jgi:nucleoside 2-deoxyribosyltransferase